MDKLDKLITIKENCERLGLSYANITSYKRDHPELSYEEVFEYYLHKDKEPLTKKCERLGLNYEQVRGFKKTHKELDVEQILELFVSGKQKDYVRQKTIQRNKEKKNNKLLLKKAYRSKSNIKVKGKVFRDLHDMLIYYDINNKYENIRSYLYNHPEKTYEEVLKLYGAISPEDRTKLIKLKRLCKENGLHYGRVHKFMLYHGIDNIEDVINSFKDRIIKDRITFTFIYNNKIEVCDNFREFCNRFNLEYEKIKRYSNKHNLSYIESIINFKPNYYINILGVLVIPDNE